MSIREFVDNLKSNKKTELKSLYKRPVPETKGEMPVAQVFEKSVYQQADILYLPEDKGFKFLLVVVDLYDDSIDAEPVKDILSKDNDVLQAFRKIYSRNYLEFPLVLTLDRGSEFTQSPIKEYFKKKDVKIKYNVYPHNFLIYKTLMGDKSDKVGGVKGLGQNKFEKYFPEVTGEKKISLDDIHDICAEKFKEHVIYCRALENFNNLRKAYKIMNLSNPMLDEQEKEHILEQIKESPYELNIETFLRFYHKDGLGNVLKNVDFCIRDNWTIIDRYNKAKNK
jgi:hypothetical protein